MGIETLTRGAKLSYEEWKAQEPNGIDKLLFPSMDVDTSAAFAMDRLIESPYGIVYRDANNQSHVRPYEPGTGYIYTVPRASEKTAIPEDLKDAAISGLEPTASQALHVRKLMDDITKHHMSGHNLTKWKQAIDVIFGGTFIARGDGGNSLNLDIDFSRAAGNALTYNFTTAGNTMPKALKAMQDQLITQGASLDNQVVIMGSTWLNDFSTDSDVIAYLQANGATQLLEMQMMPPELRNTHGLKVIATFRGVGMVAPVFICTFSPGVSYVQYKGASAAAWVTATKAAMFSLNSPRYSVQRGVDAFNAAGKSERFVGDVVFDTFTENDPILDVVRSQTRHVYIPGNINHTVVSTGTFA